MDIEILLTLQQEQVSVHCDGTLSHAFPLRDVAVEINGKQHLPAPWADPVGYGKALFDALFQQGRTARTAYDTHSNRILLVAADPILQSVAWEYLYGPHGYVVCETHFVRGIPSGRKEPPASLGALQVIVVPSNPTIPGNNPLPVESEWEQLQRAVKDVDSSLTFTRARPATLAQLRKMVAGKQNQVIHFLGHGNRDEEGKAYLCFEKENSSLAPAYSLDFYNRIKDTTFLVTLNACNSAMPGTTEFSNLALSLVEKGVPYVMGMQFVVLLDSAQVFSHTLYAELGRGSSVEEAVQQARMDLSNSEVPWAVGIPVLYTSLTKPAGGFRQEEGQPKLNEQLQQPPMELTDLSRPETIFYGRAEELAELGNRLTGPNRSRLITIHAGGGQGKTALAREAAERLAWAWQGGVWSFSLGTIPEYAIWLARLAAFCSIKAEGFDQKKIEADVLNHLRAHSALLILDNAETFVEALKAEQEHAEAISQFLQTLLSETGCSMLVTSRAYLEWSGEEALELGGLSDREGAELFLRLTARRNATISLDDAAEINRAVGGHPLSLRLLAGAMLGFPGTAQEFLLDLDHQLGQARLPGKKRTARHYNLENCLSTSWNALSPGLRSAWLNLSIFNGLFQQQTGVHLLAGSEADAEARKTAQESMIQLQQRGLLEEVTSRPLREGTLSFYRMPAVARSFALRARQEKQNEATGVLSREDQQARFALAYATVAKWLYVHESDDSRATVLFHALSEEMERGINWSTGGNAGWFSMWLGWLYFRYGLHSRAQKYLEEGLECAQGIEKRLEVECHNSLGILFHSIGKPQMALRHLQMALFMRKEGGDRAGEAATHSNIGSVYDAIGQPKEALQHFLLALPIQREVGNRAGEATTLSNIGLVYDNIGQFQEAFRYYNLALPIVKEVGNRMGEASTLSNIAGIFGIVGQHQEALRFYRQALEIHKEVGNRVGESTTLNNIGLVYDNIGQFQEALRFYNFALLIEREVGDPAGEATTLNNIAMVHRATGQLQDALLNFQLALPIQRAIGNRAGEATILNNIGGIYQDNNQPQEALLYFQAALPIRKEVGDRAGEATTLNNIGMACYAIGQLKEALRYYQMALAITREVGNRSWEAITLKNIGQIHQDQGQHHLAIEIIKQVIEIDRIIGAAQSEADNLFSLATLLHQLSRAPEAISLLEQSTALFHQHKFEQDEAGRLLMEHEQMLAILQSGASSSIQTGLSID